MKGPLRIDGCAVAGICVAAVSVSKHALAETWECKARSSWSDSPVVVTATDDQMNRAGRIEVAGTILDAEYGVEGFNRRRSFGEMVGESNRYSFFIEPSGNATYVDFGSRQVPAVARAQQPYFCREQTELDQERREAERLAAEE